MLRWLVKELASSKAKNVVVAAVAAAAIAIVEIARAAKASPVQNWTEPKKPSKCSRRYNSRSLNSDHLQRRLLLQRQLLRRLSQPLRSLLLRLRKLSANRPLRYRLLQRIQCRSKNNQHRPLRLCL